MGMKKKYATVLNAISITGTCRVSRGEKVIDYHLTGPQNYRAYAFTRSFSARNYDLVKGGIPVKKLLSVRSRDRSTMKLISYLSLMMPYFIEEIEWFAA